MPKPVTPFVGCDAFVVDQANRVLLIKRSDDGLWALPGGCQDLGETPGQCAVREVREESGYDIQVTRLLGVFSSRCYEYVNYPWKDNEFTHILFAGVILGGNAKGCDETLDAGFFGRFELPALSDGHAPRIQAGFDSLASPDFTARFE